MRSFFLLPLTILFFSCNPLMVEHFQSSNHEKNGTIYYLPKTTLDLKIEVERTQFYPGPYASFAKKLTGIENVKDFSSTTFRIADLYIGANQQPDPSACFIINRLKTASESNAWKDLLQQGSIFTIATLLKPSNSCQTEILKEYPSFIFRDLSMDDYVEVRTDTLYKTIMSDSTFVQVPVYKKDIIDKSPEEKAREAAHQLFKLRKRHVKMISGDYSFIPQNESLSICINELKRLEDEYLSLFIGKTIKDTLVYTFYMEPEKNKQTYSLGAFSATNGLICGQTDSTSNLWLQIQQNVLQRSSDSLFFQKPQKGIAYKVPAISKVSVVLNEIPKMETDIPFYQFGTMLLAPIK